MLSKNNTNLLETKNAIQKHQRFALRKLSIGVASVLLGTTMFLGTESIAHADTETAQDTPATAQQTPMNQINTSDTNKTDILSNVTNSTNNNQENNATKQVNQSVNNLDTQQFKPQKASVAPSIKEVEQSNIAQPKDAEANVQYPENGNSVAQGDWFKIHVASGNLQDVKQGDTYQVQIGQNLPLNYDNSGITTPDFNVTNNGDGTFDLTAKSNYQTANFDINASMSYTEPLNSDKTIDIPVTISHENNVLRSLEVSVNMTPAPQLPEEQTHPVLYYRCYGNVPGTDKIAWGVYINYTKQPLKDLNVTATFGGEQKLLINTINVYTPNDITQGIDQTSYPDNTYNYDLSVNTQKDSSPTGLHLDDSTINGYSDKPVYIYFQTECPTYDQNNPDIYTSDIKLSADGITKTITTKPASSGNSGNSDGSNTPKPVSETKTVNETIEYLYKDTNKQAAPTYTAQPLTFTRTGEKDPVTDQITWNAWTPAQDFSAVTSPVLKGYTADKLEIAKQTVEYNSDDLHFIVYYTKNPNIPVSESKTVNETIEYLYKDTNKQAAPAYKAQPLTFTRTGEQDPVTDEITWNAWTPAQDFSAVTSPVLKGYTADKLEIAKQTVNHDSDDLHFVVYYTKNPNIPVSETKTVNETIEYLYKDTNKQAAPTYTAQPLTFTRTGEKDPVTDQITWNAWTSDQKFKAVTSPEIKGYTPDQAEIETQTVSHDSKDLHFVVYYTKNPDKRVSETKTVHETIEYLYKDTDKQAAPTYTAQPLTFTDTGEQDPVTDEITWDAWTPAQDFSAVTSPVLKGYTADKLEIAKQTVNHDSKDLHFVVYYTKNPNIPVSESKTVHETIEYLYKDTNKQAAPTYTAQPLTFTRTGEKDPVTDEITWNAWTPAQDFSAVTSPVLKGYTADKLEIAKQTVSHDSDDLHFVVYYTKNVTPEIPTETTGITPKPVEQSNQPQSANQPAATGKTTVATPVPAPKSNHSQPVPTQKTTLPQTGNQSMTGLFALGIAGLTSALALALRKKNN